MPIRPIDIRRKEFRNGFRGYDANQVDDFLDTVADEFERNYNENQRMREEVSGLRDRLQQFEDLEGSIRAALVHAEQAANDLRRSANKEAEDVRQSARREAEFTTREAQNRSHQMLADSSARIERVQDSYEALQEAKRSFGNDFRHLLKTYMEMIENMEVSSAREIEASLHDRLDTESMAVVREAAARQEEPAFPAQASAGPADQDAADLDDPGATQRIEPASATTIEPEGRGEVWTTEGTGPLAEGPPESEQETQVLRGEGSALADTGADEPSTQEQSVEEPREEASGEPAADEPVAEGPETDPSTTQTDESRDAEDESRAEEVGPDREETSLAEESRSHEFFDKDPTRQEGGDSRISRASRFLRRRE